MYASKDETIGNFVRSSNGRSWKSKKIFRPFPSEEHASPLFRGCLDRGA